MKTLKLIKNLFSRYELIDLTEPEFTVHRTLDSAMQTFKTSANEQIIFDKWRKIVVAARGPLII